jgi:predicted alpha/beta-fold hydrolase
MMHALHAAEWDVLAWNMRGCGDEPNHLVTWYHSGQSKDLKAVVSFAKSFGYSEIALVGFSVGGNITLKYLGEEGRSAQGLISRAVVISVPMDLAGSAAQLARSSNAIYMQYLLRPLRRRMKQKAQQFPDTFDIRGLSAITTFHEFDARFTAPFHGFSSVDEYWERSSSRNYVHDIAIPTLAITSIDDPFLSRTCIPDDIAKELPLFTLEASHHGGHVGFIETPRLTSTWSEQRAVTFLNLAR